MPVFEFAISAEQAARYSEWQLCQAWRIVWQDGRATLEFTNDLEALTAPEPQS